jgi:mannose-1-phosphate guanylyltransferase
MILAAGFGTRLQPLTLELPKPAVPVGDRPLIAHVARACRARGIQQLVVNAHHRAAELIRIIKEIDPDIQVSVEDEILGTAGGVAAARPLLGREEVLVWNGDILTEPPIAELLEVARSEPAALVLAVKPRPRGEGSVGVGARGEVVRLRGRVFGDEHEGGDYVGVMALGAEALLSLPARGCLIGDVALPRLEQRQAVQSVESAAPFSDLGDVESYARENFAWLERHAGEASFVGPLATLDPGVELERCLVGERARVTGRGRLHRVICWPGARVEAPLSDAIVLGSGRVVRLAGA